MLRLLPGRVHQDEYPALCTGLVAIVVAITKFSAANHYLFGYMRNHTAPIRSTVPTHVSRCVSPQKLRIGQSLLLQMDGELEILGRRNLRLEEAFLGLAGICHLGTLVYLLCFRWKPLKYLWSGKRLHPSYIAYTLLVSNFIGVVFARTLHYQFYSWYFHALPFLLWISDRSWFWKGLTLVGIEYAFNVFPATAASSAVLQLCHLIILWGLLKSPFDMNMRVLLLEEDTASDKKDK